MANENSFMVGITVFFLAAGACVALYLAISPHSRTVDERFADLAVKGARVAVVRSRVTTRTTTCCACSSNGPPSVSRRRTLDSPTGEKLRDTLAQAGFLKSSAAHSYQVMRVLLAIGGGILGLIIGLIFHPRVGYPAAARHRRHRDWNLRAQLLPGTARAVAPSNIAKAALRCARFAGGMRRGRYGTI